MCVPLLFPMVHPLLFGNSWENWNVEVATTLFSGDKDDPENTFGKMEDFSHTLVGLYYNF